MAPLIFLFGAGRDIVGPGQVVVGQVGQIQDVIVSVFCAFSPGRLVQGVTDKEMRAGEDPFIRYVRKFGFPADGAILLGVGFVPVLDGNLLALPLP